MSELLKKRNQRILQAVVKDYIHTALPVGSSKITQKYKLDLSPATVRNVMASLEEIGLLEQPHASAGRIPTDLGFRYYVDMLVEPRPLTRVQKEMIRRKYEESASDMSEVIRETSRILSHVSRYTSLVLAHSLAQTTLKQIAFVKLDSKRILVILVSDAGIVHNKVIEDGGSLTQDDLTRASNYLNSHMRGLPLVVVKEKIVEEMEEEKVQYDRILSRILQLSKSAFEEEFTEIYIDGQSNILDQPEFVEDIEKMKALFKAFEEKGILIRLLDKALETQGIRVFIGGESKLEEMADCAVVAACYYCAGVPIGTLGILGPKRMDYSRIIPIVEYTAKVVGHILEGI